MTVDKMKMMRDLRKIEEDEKEEVKVEDDDDDDEDTVLFLRPHLETGEVVFERPPDEQVEAEDKCF